MPKEIKLSLEDLKVESFTTSNSLKGGFGPWGTDKNCNNSHTGCTDDTDVACGGTTGC